MAPDSNMANLIKLLRFLDFFSRMCKVDVEEYCEIPSVYFDKKRNAGSHFFSDLYATRICLRIILQTITQPVRLNRWDFFFVIQTFIFRGSYFCLLSTIVVFLFLLKRQGSSNIIINGKRKHGNLPV